ncbi:Apoptosis-inducing factor-like protein [Nymphaea thermarum]|nr:Apoptosis-inducing factor-like protein [Nymphaea thermarum]
MKCRKDYYEVPWAALRCMVEPAFAQRSLIEHKHYLSNARVVTSTAVKVSEREVVTSGGRCIPYDYLVIATGHPNTFPTTRSERLQQFRESYEKIRASSSILIVGGGPTGVELAGEIAVDFPDKHITIVHKGYRLLEFIGPKASEKALAWLTSRKVQVLFNQQISLEQLDDAQTEFVTSEGAKVRVDCWFNCIGKGLGSSWLTDGILQDCLNERGQLMVDEHLRVAGKKNIFAIGDITDIRVIIVFDSSLNIQRVKTNETGYIHHARYEIFHASFQ